MLVMRLMKRFCPAACVSSRRCRQLFFGLLNMYLCFCSSSCQSWRELAAAILEQGSNA